MAKSSSYNTSCIRLENFVFIDIVLQLKLLQTVRIRHKIFQIVGCRIRSQQLARFISFRGLLTKLYLTLFTHPIPSPLKSQNVLVAGSYYLRNRYCTATDKYFPHSKTRFILHTRHFANAACAATCYVSKKFTRADFTI